MEICIVDSIMGSGKTSAAINKINEDTENRYLFVTPFLDEVERIINSCDKTKIFQPEYKGKGGKLKSLHYLLGKRYNIASTHALFQLYDSDTKNLIKQGDYILILDEVFQVVEFVPKFTMDDLNNIVPKHAHIEDYFLIWDNDDCDSRYNDIKNMAKNKSLVVYDDNILLWNFPIEVFKAFKKVYVLTYMFKSQQQRYYYDFYNVKYKYIGINNNQGYYTFSDKTTIPPYIYNLKNNINILSNDKINSIGDDYYNLSSSWFKRELETKYRFLLKTLKNNLVNYFINKTKSSSDDAMWTTFLDAKKALSGKGYTKGFISVNTRATNNYRHKKNLAYCANIFLNPIIKQFFQIKDIDILEEEYGLSEMIQWIWRSAIRDEKPIDIYIPSARMRNLLIDWLDKTSAGKI